jgi:hypothetical protein
LRSYQLQFPSITPVLKKCLPKKIKPNKTKNPNP